MDRKTVYRDQIPYETDVLYAQRFAFEAIGLLAMDFLGSINTKFGGLVTTETSPTTMGVKVGPGRIYGYGPLEPADWGKISGTGGLSQDLNADHYFMRQGIKRDSEILAIPAPVTVGQSINYLIQGRIVYTDDAAASSQFYNSANPNAPITQNVSPFRRDGVQVASKAGTSATTGTQTTPAADAGWIPLYVVAVPYGAAAITNAMISIHPSAPTISLGGGGGGGGTPLPTWTFHTGTGTMAKRSWNRPSTAGGAYTLNLPASPSAGDDVRIMGNFATNNLTVGRNGSTIVSSATDMVMNLNNMDVTYLFDGTTWIVGTP